MFSALSVCAALFLSDALAVAPTDFEGHEPVRVYRTNGQAQAAFRRTPAWKSFAEAEGKGWTVRVDEATGTPHRMWGAGIDLGPVDTAAQVEEGIRGFIARHGDLLGIEGQPALRNLSYAEPTHTWYVDFVAEREGIAIWRAGATFRIKHDNLVLVGAATYPRTPQRGEHILDIDTAIDAAIAAGPAPDATHTDAQIKPYWLPRMEDNLLVLRAVYEVRTATESPIGEWVSFVDAETGELVAFYNEVRHLTGQVTAEHDARYPGAGLEISPVPFATIGSGLTDANGNFDIPENSATARVDGSPMNLSNQLGNRSLSVNSSTPQWNQGNGDLAELDVWIHTGRVRDTFAPYSPDVSWTNGAADITVNINDVCNAYYVGGTVNFFSSGGGCNNTGRLADVIYHEWGHGLHDYSLRAGYFDGALSEGAGDVVSFLMTGDHQMAPGFFQNGSFLRNVENTNTYPDDIVDQVHTDGLIFGGAMWDTYVNIENQHGTAVAKDDTQHMLAGMLRAGVGIPESLSETLLADDDDGSLGNGTPNECEIVAGFAAHGLGELGDSIGFVAGHAPIAQADTGVDHDVAVEIVGPASCSGDFAGGTATVNWRADGGSWQDAPLTVNGTNIQGAIPSQPFGTFVEYYIEVVGPQTLSAPTKGWRNPYSFYVGGVIPVRCDDFDSNDGGYTHSLLAGTAGEGADDWQHGAPAGLAGDPAQAHSGSNIWGNDLGGGDYNGEYQNDKHNQLQGPSIPLGHYEQSFLHYWRWLNIEDGIYDVATISANGSPVWSNVAVSGEDHHEDDQWTPHAVDLNNPSGSVQIAWDLTSDGGLTMGGWNIDDVCIHAPATVNNRLGVTDFVAGEGQEGGVSLSWTNPPHAPLAEVRVVRKSGGCPVDAEDGDVVFFDNNPSLGGPVNAWDAVPTTDTYCYGVFPGDGTDFLGFTEPGWNIDEGSATQPATQEEIDEQEEENGVDEFEEIEEDEAELGEDGAPTDSETPVAYADLGCGCNGSAQSAAGAWIVLLGFLIRRRRS